MFLKKSTTTINGKTYNHYKVVESYREDGKVKHRILFALGSLTDEQAERLRMAISAHSNPDIIVSKSEDIVVTKHLAFLDVAVLFQLWQDWGFHNFFTEDRWVKAMVFNRCIDPVAKINVKDWAVETVLPVYLDTQPNRMDTFDVYRELDRLSNRESELQSFIFQQLKSQFQDLSEVFFYDITSTYMEGNRCVISKLGYSRDHRPDCEQIVIALMITPEGYPFYWRVLEGNTQDITTVKDLVREVKTRYGIQNCTMVFDRGMVSSDNLLTLEDQEWEYVSAMDRDEIATAGFFDEALPEPATSGDWEQIMAMREFIPFDEDGFLFFREFQVGNRRYILSFDVTRFLDEQKMLERRIKQVLDWVQQKNQNLAQAKKARSREKLECETQMMLKRKRVKKFLSVQIEPHAHTVPNKKGEQRTVESFQLSSTLEQTQLHKEQRLHGITCFITNLSKDHSSARDIIQWYRRKNKVEEAFREIKSHLQLRPIHLTRENRVKAHVTICMLAYFLYNDLERRLKNKGVAMSPVGMLELLAKCQINKVEFKGNYQPKLSITEPSSKQKELLQAIGCESTIDPKPLKQILKKVENWL